MARYRRAKGIMFFFVLAGRSNTWLVDQVGLWIKLIACDGFIGWFRRVAGEGRQTRQQELAEHDAYLFQR